MSSTRWRIYLEKQRNNFTTISNIQSVDEEDSEILQYAYVLVVDVFIFKMIDVLSQDGVVEAFEAVVYIKLFYYNFYQLQVYEHQANNRSNFVSKSG